MKKPLTLVILILITSVSFSPAQSQTATDDSSLSKRKIIVSDSLVNSISDSLLRILNQSDSIRIRFIFKNDHRWNNWALDTTLTKTDIALFNKSFLGRQPFRLKYKYIPLTSYRPTTREKVKKYLKPGLASLALLSNWGSFYLKRVADDYYDRYRSTSNLHEINYYYRKTQQFDQWSIVLLGVSVVSISVYLYLLLKG